MNLNRRDAVKLLGLTALALSMLTTMKEADLTYCLGKKPARPEAVKLRLGDYIKPSKLPTPPGTFGHENLVPDWKMLGNDQVGDCAVAGPFHALMLWCAEGKSPVSVNDACTIAAYSAITGYNPAAYDPYTKENPTDQGSDVQEVAEYWRTTGLTDANGNVHKIDAYLALEPGNVEQLFHALYLFDGVGIGIECPKEYQQAFYTGQVWDAVSNPHIVGGHYILGVGARNGLINTVTWGRTQLLTPAGYRQFNDETFAYFSREKLIDGKDIDGFDVKQLMSDLEDIASEGKSQPVVCG